MSSLDFDEFVISPPPPVIEHEINMYSLENIKILSQNCNSLNLSSNNINRDQGKCSIKLNAILKNKANIICLQDTRVSKYESILKNLLLLNKYGSFKVFLNSSLSERGVVTLINKNTPHTIFKLYKSHCQNIIMLDMSINNCRFLLINCYAPTQNENRNFFPSLKLKINQIGIKKFCIMGDLNALTCNLPINLNNILSNYEVLNMVNIPNPIHTNYLVQWLNEDFCVDKFRILYPNSRMFSYIPFNNLAVNRSRIDHCLVSNEFSPLIANVQYYDRSSKFFDHKPIMVVGKKKNTTNSKSIDPSLLKIKFLYDTVKFEVLHFFVSHFNIPDRNNLERQLEIIQSLSRTLQCLEAYIKIHPNDLLITEWINDYQHQFINMCNNFPPITYFLRYDSLYEYDAILESLLNTIKNTTISFQANYLKNLRKEKLLLSNELAVLRNSNKFFTHRFKIVEEKLLHMEHQENLRYIEDSRYFSILNCEKPTKKFSELLKNEKNYHSLSNIRDYDGNEIKYDTDKKKFISDHFKKQFSTPAFSEISISDFLGCDINDPSLNSYKLNADDRDRLELPIDIAEVEEVLKNANLNSSVGLDGIPMKALVVFWELLKDITVLAFNSMFDKSKLKGLMNISKIKLIEKGGDKDFTKIGNWRPIGIQTSTYKLYSGVINLRLKSVIDKIIHPSQKAYSKEHFLHECLINIFEMISKSNATHSPLASLIIDFSKAFDSISHSYIESILKFSNFGPKFCSLVSSTLKNRKACIWTEFGITPNFDTVIGVIQGDLPSPNFFKVAVNPLIIKLCKSTVVKIPREIPYRFDRNTHKVPVVNAFADDMQNFMSPKPNVLQECYNILKNFGKLSNLRINNNKTTIVITGGLPSLDFLRKVNELNFTLTDEFCILGLKLHKSLANINNLWENTLLKICRIRNFWNIFNLSIPGRINIIKTFFYSQLSFLGAIFEPPENFINEFKICVINFLKQGGKIAKDRIFLEIDKGGLGLADPYEFISSLKVNVYIKGLKSTDSWGLELKSFLANPLVSFSTQINIVNKPTNPILYNLIKAFIRFCQYYWLYQGNILNAQIVDNFFFLDGNNAQINNSFFNPNTWRRSQNNIQSLVIADFFEPNGNLYNYDDFCLTNSVFITPNEFIRLKYTLRAAIKKGRNKINLPSNSILTFLANPKNRAKDYRLYSIPSSHNIQKCKPMKSRYMWAELPIDIDREKFFYPMWGTSFLPMSIKDFAFKIINNQLNFNANLSKFSTTNIDPSCIQCILSNTLPAPRETSRHFFLFCPTNVRIMETYFNSFLQNRLIAWDSSFCLLGAHTNLPFFKKLVLNTEIILVSYFLFECRKNKITPLFNNLSNFTDLYRETFLKFPKYLKCWQKWNST